MVLLPRWRCTRVLLRSPLVLAPLAAMYGVLLQRSWNPDTFSLVLPGSWEAGLSRELWVVAPCPAQGGSRREQRLPACDLPASHD